MYQELDVLLEKLNSDSYLFEIVFQSSIKKTLIRECIA